MSTTLDDARERVIKLFTELQSEGVHATIASNFGRPPAINLKNNNLYDSEPTVEVGAYDWHPEWWTK